MRLILILILILLSSCNTLTSKQLSVSEYEKETVERQNEANIYFVRPAKLKNLLFKAEIDVAGQRVGQLSQNEKAKVFINEGIHQIIVTRPLEISEVLTSYDVRCSVKGGGLSGQAGAIILGISKALITHDETLQKNLKKDKLTTRDSRVVERKKYGRRKARRSFQFSKR